MNNTGFYANTSDTDAILRRFDFNGNTRLDYNEFYELVTGVEYQEEASPKEAKPEAKAKVQMKDEPMKAEDLEADNYDEDEFESPDREVKNTEEADLKSSKPKEVRISEKKPTTAPAKKLDMDEEFVENKKNQASPYERER